MFAPLLAQAPAHPAQGWTDKEVMLYLFSAVGGTLLILVPVAWGLVKLLTGRAVRRAAKLEAENRGLRRKLDDLDPTGVAAELQEKLAEEGKKVGHLETTLAQVRTQADGFETAAKGLEGERDELRAQLAEAAGDLAAERKRIKKAVEKDGV